MTRLAHLWLTLAGFQLTYVIHNPMKPPAAHYRHVWSGVEVCFVKGD